jgi:hypothetical protein
VAKRPTKKFIPCSARDLPADLLVAAAQTAAEINPANAPRGVYQPARIAELTQKYWGPKPLTLTVSFMEPTAAELQRKILAYMNRWNTRAATEFVLTSGVGQVRISRGRGGYYSYLGTDILHIPANQPTMNLEAFVLKTPDSEYERVVTHETGHTLGFPHEHMRAELVARIDPKKAYDYFLRTQGWDRDTVDQQVLTPLSEAALMATPPDQTSIMCYQLPASITKDGKPVVGGATINETDFAFAARLFPKADAPPPPPSGSPLLTIDPAARTVALPAGWTVKQ